MIQPVAQPPVPQAVTIEPVMAPPVGYQDYLNRKVLGAFQQIVADTHHRMTHSEADPALLNQGLFYSNWYATALLKNGPQNLRYVSFLKKKAFCEGLTLSPHWEKIPNPYAPTGNIPDSYILKKGHRPSEALLSLRDSLMFSNCFGAVQIAWYRALLEELGEEKFDSLFSSEGPLPLQIGALLPNYNFPFHYLISTVTVTPQTMSPGQEAYIQGCSSYDNEHIGFGQGYHVLSMPQREGGHKSKFTALGLPAEGLTKKEISDLLLEDFNADATDPSLLVPEELRGHPYFQQMSQATRVHQAISKSVFLQNGGGAFRKSRATESQEYTDVYELDGARIFLLKNTPVDQCSRLFTQWIKDQSLGSVRRA